jgi:hypothetical protein
VNFPGEQFLRGFLTVRRFHEFTGDFQPQKDIFYNVTHDP